MKVDKLQTKAKLSQNKSREEQIRISEFLLESSDRVINTIGEYMQENIKTK